VVDDETSDINMPGMTGLEMLPKVRELRPHVPVIMIAAYGDAETKRKAMEGGARGLPTKPIELRRAARGNRRQAAAGKLKPSLTA
jgi:DNA-binding NtrC family response regulator